MRKTTIILKIAVTTSASLLLVAPKLQAAESITVDVGNVLKTFSSTNPVGMNASYLMDSDINYSRTITTEDQFHSMQLGSVRFPFGHLANNYLWDDDGTYGGTLTPKVGTTSVTPGSWSFAVNATDRSLINSMDFDEYLEMADRLGFEPLVVVNAMGHRHPGGPTFAKIVESAAEWVKYAKQRHDNDGMPKVKYWQIGNEQDHHWQYWKFTFLPLDDTWDAGVNNTCLGVVDDGLADDGINENDYVNVYKTIAATMKAEDSTILTGPGLLKSKNWFNKLWAEDPANFDFVSAHQYTFGRPWSQGGYTAWRDNTANLVENINDVQERIDNTNDTDGDGLDPQEIPLLITEMGPFGNWPEGQGIVDTYRALANFEMQMEALAVRNTLFTYLWTSRSPFAGLDGPTFLASALTTDSTGKRTPIATIMKIINEGFHDELVSATRQAGKVRTYVSHDSVSGDVTLFLLNKDDASTSVSVNFTNYTVPNNYDRYVFKGTSYDDPSPEYTQTGTISKSGNYFSTTLDPVSLTVVKLYQSFEGHWKFDESSGTSATDSSGQASNATLNNGATFASGLHGNALSLDGSDDYAETPFILNPANTDHTATAWVKLDVSNGTRQTILQQLGGGATWLFRTASNGKLGSWGGVAVDSISSIPVGEWTHVGVVVEGNQKYLFVNGNAEASATISSYPSVATGMRIGRHKSPNTTNEEWDGLIDDVRIYDKALTNAEMIALYHAGAPETPNPDPIVSEYFVDQTYGSSPSGWTIGGTTGTATIEGIPNDQRTLFSSWDSSLRLRDTGSNFVSAKKTWSAQTGKTVINFGLRVNTRRGGAWLYILDSSGSTAVRLKVDAASNEIWAYDGSTAVTLFTGAFTGSKDLNPSDNDCSATPIIKSKKITIIADPATDTYQISGSGNSFYTYDFLNNTSDIGGFSFQTIQADESESPWVDEMSDYDVNLDYLHVAEFID